MLIWAPNFILRQTGTNCWSHAHMIPGYHKYVWMSSLSSDSHSSSDSSKFFFQNLIQTLKLPGTGNVISIFYSSLLPELASRDTSAGLPNASPDQTYGSGVLPHSVRS